MKCIISWNLLLQRLIHLPLQAVGGSLLFHILINQLKRSVSQFGMLQKLTLKMSNFGMAARLCF